MRYPDDYVEARKAAMRYIRKAQQEGRYPFLPALDEMLGNEASTLSQVRVGYTEIPVSMIVGTKTRGRQNSFAGNWMPTHEMLTEFGSKWDRVLEYQMESGITDPIKCYEYMRRFYVQEGNKRVSVTKWLDVPTLPAEVIRIMPKRSDDPDVKTYYEFVNFYRLCPVYEIEFSRPGEYKAFVELIGQSLTEPWPMETVKATEGAYFRFKRSYDIVYPKGLEGMTPADAMLVYLSVYTLQSLIEQPRAVVEERIRKLSEEFKSSANEDNIALQKAPAASVEKNRGFFTSLFNAPVTYTEEKPLKVAFVYDSNPQTSAWIQDQEIGRIYIKNRFEGRIESSAYFNCRDDEAVGNAISDAKENGAHVIITTSPAMMPRTVQASLAYDKIRFLNMSLNLSHRTVRTYYSRMYEVKFLMGALAASYCRNHRIGYLAENPIYGDIANINAFAIGAAIVDPQSKIYLEWSTVEGSDWRKSFRDNDISVISGPDYAWYEPDTTEQGVFAVNEDGSISNLANPIFNWGKYYELILKQIINGTYDDDPSLNKNQATNYWYGLSAGVIDLTVSESIAYYSRKLIGILKKGIKDGSIHPFSGEINTQNGQLQGQGAKLLDDVSIIEMNWLNDNVIGHIPTNFELNQSAREVAAVSGVTDTLKKAKKVVSE